MEDFNNYPHLMKTIRDTVSGRFSSNALPGEVFMGLRLNSETMSQGLIFTLPLTFIILSHSLLAQEMGSCAMCGSMGWAGMVLGGILILVLIAALIALSIFLFLRRQPRSHS